jgi:hypothetical protein
MRKVDKKIVNGSEDVKIKKTNNYFYETINFQIKGVRMLRIVILSLCLFSLNGYARPCMTNCVPAITGGTYPSNTVNMVDCTTGNSFCATTCWGGGLTNFCDCATINGGSTTGNLTRFQREEELVLSQQSVQIDGDVKSEIGIEMILNGKNEIRFEVLEKYYKLDVKQSAENQNVD